MKFRSGLLAVAGVATLLLAGCSTTVEGSAQAALPMNGVAGSLGDAGDLGSLLGGLADGDGSNGDLGDLGALLGGLDGSSGDSSGDGGAGDLGDLGALLGGLGDGSTGDPGDLGALMGGLMGGMAGMGLSDECAAMLSAQMQVGLLMMGPVMGGPGPTKQRVDQAFSNTKNLPPELAGPIGVLHKAAEASIGKSAAEAMSILDADDVDAAMDALGDYADAHCDTE